MSKRAEQKALEAYPKSEKYTSSQRLIINDLRDGFIQGYKQAEKDTIDRACKWLEENVVIYPHADNKPLCIINLDTFRKAMEEDQ